MKPKFTPGSWRIFDGNSTTLNIDESFGASGGRDYYLASVRHGDPDELLANARLIAAAPQLFSAAVKALKLLDSVAFVSKEGDSASVIKALQSAIRKVNAK